MSALLEIVNLSVDYPVKRGGIRRDGFFRAVNQVSLTVAKGETYGLVGESGCGKTSLARAVAGLTPFSQGRILFDGRDLLQPSKAEKRGMEIQMIFQDPGGSLNPRMNVEELVAEPFKIHGMFPSSKERREKVTGLLTSVGLSESDLPRYPHEFSGGQKQRIAVARALALKPQLIICDEPVSALDVSVQGQVINMLLDLQQSFGMSFLFVAHDLAVVEQISHRIGVMYLGKIVEEGDSKTLSGKPGHPYTQALAQAVPSREKRGLWKARVEEKPRPPGDAAGCPYTPRCPFAQARCHSETPELRQIAPDRKAACHFAEEVMASASNPGPATSAPGGAKRG